MKALSSFLAILPTFIFPVHTRTVGLHSSNASCSLGSASCASDDADSPILLNLYGRVYDVTSFADRHPGGRRILQDAANLDLPDATPLFESYHAFRNASEMLSKLALYDTGRPSAYPQLFTFEEDGFYRDVRRRAANVLPPCPRFGSPGSLTTCMVKGGMVSHMHLLLCSAMIVMLLVVASMTRPLMLAVVAALLAGAFLIRTSIVEMHDATHMGCSETLATNKFLGDVAASAIFFDARTWTAQHMLHHHVYTGSVALDVDVTFGWPVFRKQLAHPWAGRPVPFAIEQLFFIAALPGQWLLQVGTYELMRRTSRQLELGQGNLVEAEMLYEPMFNQSLPRRLLGMLPQAHKRSYMNFLGEKAWLTAMISCWLPLWVLFSIHSHRRRGVRFPLATCRSIALALATVVGANAFYALTVLAQHDAMEPHSDIQNVLDRSKGPFDWGELQVRASSDWYDDYGIADLIWRGTNRGSIHHLFPAVHPNYLPHLAPVVHEAMRDHGIPINDFPSVLPALHSGYLHLASTSARSGARASLLGSILSLGKEYVKGVCDIR